jgi:MATE family multidrug resistance protein
MAMGLVDTWMVAPLGPRALAAVGLGNAVFFPIVLLFLGILIALDTLVAQAHGKGRDAQAGHLLGQGLWLALAMGLPLAAAFQWSEPVLLGLGQAPEVADPAARYLEALGYCVPPFMGYTAYRGFCHGLGDTRRAMGVTLAANLVNAGANYVLLYGALGFPRLGVAGLGYATALSRLFMFLALAALAHGPRFAAGEPRITRPDPKTLREILTLGVPIGGLILLEAGGFSFAGVMVGWLGELPLAGHQVVLTVASFTFMVPLGLATGAALVVGQDLGRDQPEEAAANGRVTLVLAAAFMTCTGTLFWLVPDRLVGLFTDHPGTVAVAAGLFPMAAFFQLFDGLQCVAGGCLRGAGDTRTTLRYNLIGFWVLGLPLGYLLAFRAGLGARGVWAGLACALVCTGTLLTRRFLSGDWKPAS